MCRPAAHECLHGVVPQKVKVLVAAVDEQDAVAALGQPLEMLLLRLVAGPEEAEIPQHDERVAFF